jgi:hypothetical protein
MSGKLNEEKEGVSYDSFKEKLQSLDKHELNILKKHFLKGNSQKVAEYLRKKYFKDFEWDEIVSCVEIFFGNEKKDVVDMDEESKYFGKVNQIVSAWEDHFLGKQFDSEGKILDILDGFVKSENRFGGNIEDLWDTNGQFRREVEKKILGLYQTAYPTKVGSGVATFVMKRPQFASSAALGRAVGNMKKSGGPVVGEGKLLKEYGGACDFGSYAVDSVVFGPSDELELIDWVEDQHEDGLTVYCTYGYGRPGFELFSVDPETEIPSDTIETCMWDLVNDDWFVRMNINKEDLLADQEMELEENKKMIKEQEEPKEKYWGGGKFNSALDELLYSAVLEGWTSEEAGDVSEQGVHYDFIPLDGMESVKNLHINFKEQFEQLTEEEVAELENARAAIIEENDQGFIAVELFNSKEEADEKWAEIEYGLTGEDDQTVGVEEDNEDDLMGEQKKFNWDKTTEEYGKAKGAIDKLGGSDRVTVDGGVLEGSWTDSHIGKPIQVEDEDQVKMLLAGSSIKLISVDEYGNVRATIKKSDYDKYMASGDMEIPLEGIYVFAFDEELIEEGAIGVGYGQASTCPCKKCDDEDEEDEDLKEAKKQIVKERFSDISGVDDISIEDELDPKGVDDYLPEDELDDEFLKGSDTDPLDDDGEEF